jgi:hypothetical protein
MGFRRTRPGVTNRWNHERGTWTSPDAYANLPPYQAPTATATLERIAHPVVEAPAFKCYRVIRLFMLQGHLQIEDIGFGSTPGQAMSIATHEQWRCQVLDPNGKVYSDNWRTMERR